MCRESFGRRKPGRIVFGQGAGLPEKSVKRHGRKKTGDAIRRFVWTGMLMFLVIGCIQEKGTITGTVMDAGGGGMANQTVVVEPGPYVATTDADGTYSIQDVPFGIYTVSWSNHDLSVDAPVGEDILGCRSFNIGAETVVRADLQMSDAMTETTAFPVEVGNRWIYSVAQTLDTEVDEGTVTRTVTGVEEVSGTDCRVVEDEYIFGSTMLCKAWYSQTADEFLEHASESSGAWLPTSVLPGSIARFTFMGRSFDSISDISRFIWTGRTVGQAGPGVFAMSVYDTPSRVLDFPLTVSKYWTYADSEGFIAKRRVLSKEFVTVPAGTFYCTKVEQYYVPGFGELDIYIWHSPIGVVKSGFWTTIEVWDEFGNYQGEMDFNEEYELLGYAVESP